MNHPLYSLPYILIIIDLMYITYIVAYKKKMNFVKYFLKEGYIIYMYIFFRFFIQLSYIQE